MFFVNDDVNNIVRTYLKINYNNNKCCWYYLNTKKHCIILRQCIIKHVIKWSNV